ncbi:MAG: glycosyltransferase family 2 protein [Conexivisphaerales archaeon]
MIVKRQEVRVPEVSKDDFTVVLPTLNEGEAIVQVIREVKDAGYSNIIVVDGYSNDNTVKLAKENGVEYVVSQYGKGKAGALITAFKLAPTQYVAVLDADGSYNPANLERFLLPMRDHDFVKGERLGKPNMSRLHRLGNYLITKSFNYLFGSSIPDVCSGMYCIKASVAKSLEFQEHPMAVEQEILAQLLASDARITSVQVEYRKRLGGKTKTKTWKQGFTDIVTNIELARTYSPMLLFSLIASIALLPAAALLAYSAYAYIFNGVYHGGYVLASLMLFVIGGQGLTVATIGSMLRRLERRINAKND